MTAKKTEAAPTKKVPGDDTVYVFDDGSDIRRHVRVVGRKAGVITVRDTSTGDEYTAKENQLAAKD